MREKRFDKTFLASVLILLVVGFFIFISAALGLLDRTGATFKQVVFNQIFFGLFFGLVAMAVCANINYKIWRKYAFYLFSISFVATLLVFVPHLGFAYNGARRWISIGSFSLQPAEILKVGFLLYWAALVTSNKNKIKNYKEGLVPFLILTGLTGLTLLAQPDTDTFFIIFFAALGMYIVAGCRWRDIFIMMAVAVVGFGGLYATRPYIRARVDTFIHPAANALTSGYQAQQSLIAIGSGRIFGRGFGQSVQKFQYLPEPIGDSIFAVAGEEFGFVGSVAIVLLYIFFAFRALKIAANTEETFGRLIIIGIVILILSESFINIAAMLGILPLSGTPLLFVSHGGTALFFTLAEIGIILNISKYQKA